ncbi:MAG: alpha/beta fold hydrolase [Desulfotalea sp.]
MTEKQGKFNPSKYRPPWWLRSGHLQSIHSSLCSPRFTPNYHRQRIDTADGDFLDLDWCFANPKTKGQNLVILSHGLEGDSNRNYITGIAGHLINAGLDVLAWNYRGCSGEPNKKLRLYHNGSIDDLEIIINHVIQNDDYCNLNTEQPRYKNIFLVGFSMGGNITLLYLGKKAKTIPKEVKGAVAFSVPCDLAGAANQIGKPQNFIYMKRFLRHLHRKVITKARQFPDKINDDSYHRIKNFHDFDNRYTAPLHGFTDAEDYWKKCSCINWIEMIRTPSLMVNALDDPFLSPRCYPEVNSDFLKTIYPKNGGHVGFIEHESAYWSEQLTLEFINFIQRS